MRKKLATLKSMEIQTEGLNTALRSDLRTLDLNAADEIAISTAIYELAEGVRQSIRMARQHLVDKANDT